VNSKTKDDVGLIIGIIAVILFIGLTVFAFMKDSEGDDYIIEKSYSEVKDIINDDKKTILLVGRDDCSHCIEYRPTVVAVAKEYDLKVIYINTNTIKDKEDSKELWDFIGTDGTPTTAIVSGGKLLAVQEGTQTRSQLIAFLKANYF